MAIHIVDQYFESHVTAIDAKRKLSGEIRAARSIVDLLCETGMTIEAAAWVLDVCRNSLDFITLPKKEGRNMSIHLDGQELFSAKIPIDKSFSNSGDCVTAVEITG